jgi:signal transduction histidine kinase
MNPLRSVGARLSLALSVLVLGALGIVYLLVVPSIERRLIDTKLSQLARAAPSQAGQYRDPGTLVANFLEEAAASTNARVVLLTPSLTPTSLSVREDSCGGCNSRASNAFQDDRVALRALQSGKLTRGTVKRHGERYAEAGYPVTPTGPILLLSASLVPQLETVDLLQRRILIAGLVALAAALAVGYGGSWVFARRIRRLERAADRIAAGHFDEPIADRNVDELGELARSFDRMRMQLAQLEDARREFIANASHELRTPLFSLGGFLELLDDEDLDESTRREFLATMREQVERLSKLATDLLDLSRLDAGRLRVEQRPVDLGSLAQVLAEEFRAVAKATDHPVEVDVEGTDGVGALADSERVLQIGRALVENAIVHTPSGTRVRIRVSADNGRALLRVEDEGPGIPEEHAPRVFDRFYRVDGSRSSGSGLGLAIARELAQRMDGSIELETHAGRTSFSLLLPLVSEPDRRKD